MPLVACFFGNSMLGGLKAEEGVVMGGGEYL